VFVRLRMQSKSLSYTESIDKRCDDMEGRQSPSMAHGTENRVEPSEQRSKDPIPLHHRTNFGKKMGYVPPDTRRVPRSKPTSPNYESEVPFDQARDRATRVSQTIREPIGRVYPAQAPSKQYPDSPMTRTISESSKPFDERGEDQASLGIYDPAYIPLPPKKAETDWETSSDRLNRSQRAYYSDPDIASHFRFPPLRVADPSAHPSEMSGDISMEIHMNTPERPTADISYSEFGVARSPEGDDDSLFVFEKQRAKSRSRKGRNRRSRHVLDEDTDTSQEQELGSRSPNLQERAQAAWKLKRRSNLRAASENAPPPQTTNTATITKPTTTPATHMVSFDAKDTIHHYQPDADTEVTTLEGRSLDSEYTKSMESEVEDAFKDFLLIGNAKTNKPGRRKVKDNPRIQQQLHNDLSDEEETTLEDDDDDYESHPQRSPSGRSKRRSINDDDEDNPRERTSSRSKRRSGKYDEVFTDEKKDEEDPLSEALNWMGFGAILGLDDEHDEERYLDERDYDEEEDAGGFRSFMDYATGLVLGKTPSCEKCSREEEPHVIVPSAPSLEEDLRLIEMAEQVAYSYHRLKGYEFDEGYEIDIVEDIKFTVVDLKLPLGLIFQENERGCWVTKVLPEGSAARSKSVTVGDQLAAIDGYSAIDMKVDEIAAAVRKHGKEIELTFLRYVGPIRPAPGSLQEEGYEIRATEKEGKQQKRGLRRLMMSERQPKIRRRPKVEEKKPEAQVKGNKVESKPAEKKRFRIFGWRKQATA